MFLGIATSGKIGLGVVGGIFIAFALLASIVIPRSRPDFPGRRVGLFAFGTIVLFAAMIGAVVTFAGEEEAKGEEAAPTQTEPTGTETAPTGTEPTQTETGGGTGQGDAVAGKAVFTGDAGCTGCHTLADAGSNGQVGPNLDEAKPSFDKVVERVTNGKGVMPSFKGRLTEKQIQDVAAYVSQATRS